MKINDVLGLLMIGFPVWPPFAIALAIVFYARHRRRVEAERRVPVALYVVALLVCGGIAGFVGMFLGMQWACSLPNGGNLCGLVGVFVTGPITGTLAVVLVGLALSLISPDQEPST